MRIILLLIVASLLSSCADDPNRKENMGTVLGGATGALIGSTLGGGDGNLVAIGAGAVMIGAFIGNRVGASMDDVDKMKAEQTAQTSLEKAPSGKTSSWKNPDTGNSGSFTPKRATETERGYCREFTQQITVAGKTQQGYGTACRQPDGTWKIVN